MTKSFEITVNDAEVRAALERLASTLADPTPVMQDIGRVLANITEDAFQDERSPTGVPWEPLTPEYVLRPRKKGGAAGMPIPSCSATGCSPPASPTGAMTDGYDG